MKSYILSGKRVNEAERQLYPCDSAIRRWGDASRFFEAIRQHLIRAIAR